MRRSKIMLPDCSHHVGATGMLPGKVSGLTQCRECLRWFFPAQTTLNTEEVYQ